MSDRTCLWAVLGGGILLAGTLNAKTVALWPLECDSTGVFDGRCLVNPRGTLVPHVATGLSFEPTSRGWQQPPNADGDGHWTEVNNYKAAVNTSTSGAFAKLTEATPELFKALSVGDFTIEGWIKLSALNRGDWKAFYQSTAGGCMVALSLRHTKKKAEAVTEENPEGYVYSVVCYLRSCVAEGQMGSDYYVYEWREEEIEAFLAQWHHLAISLDHRDATSTKLRFYIDGEKVGELQTSKYTKIDNQDFALYFGGRVSDSIFARYDYWRISDVALSPSEFLNYDPEGKGGKTVVEAPTTTVAYWKLDPDSEGSLDLRNSVGDYAHLRKNSTVSVPEMSSDAQWSELNAFEPVVGGRDGNGSVTLQQPGMGLKTYLLGSLLVPTNSFVVEGWYNPEQREGVSLFDTNAFGRVFAVADPDTVWSLRLKKKADGTRVFAVEAADDTTKGGGTALASGEFSAVLPRTATWHKLRLAYDPDEGNGRWSFSFDDQAAGTVDNVRAPVYAGTIVGANVYLGSTTVPGTKGRTKEKTSTPAVKYAIPARAANDWVFGTYDSWSVGVNGSTVAQWGLDVRRNNGNTWVHCRDSVGSYHLTGLFCNDAGFANVVKTDDMPTVTNPDRSATFRGNSSVNAGSAQITANTSNKGFFICDDPRVLKLFGDGTKDFTFEYYQKRNMAMRDWEIVITGDTENFGYGTDGLNFSQRASGFKLWMAAMSVNTDKPFDNSAGVNDTTTWHHIALVRKYDPSTKKATASLYEDGNLCSSFDGTAAQHALVNVGFFGRTSGGGVCASVDEIRLSSVALEPSQFLCAATPEPAVTPTDNSRKTLGYWELDNREGAAALTNAIVTACPLSGTVTGSASVFSRKIRNPDTTTPFTGNAAADDGSVIATTPLVSSYAGLNLELDRPFTIEGWLRPTDPGVAGQELCRVSNAAGDGYWALGLVRVGETVKMSVKAVSPNSWTLSPVDGAFSADLASRLGAWTHVAVSYDPTDNGTWRLMVNGEDGGSLVNAVSPGLLSWGLSSFSLGASDGGAFDEWRLSRGVLTAEGILYRPVPGFVLSIR